MKLYCLSATLILFSGFTFQPVLDATNDNNHVIAACCAIGAAALSGLGVHWWHTSNIKKDQDAEQEKKIVEGASVLLDTMKKQGHLLLRCPQPSYQDVATIYPGRELAELKDQLHSFLNVVKAQKENLRTVTGKHGKMSEASYSAAQTLYAELVSFERTLGRYQELFDQLQQHRDRPLTMVQDLESFLKNMESQKHSTEQLLNFVSGEYGARITKDGVRKLPFVCAAEDISNKILQAQEAKRALKAHQQSLKQSDPILDAILDKLNGWESVLKQMEQSVTNSNHYSEQVKINDISKIARLNAEAEHAQEQRKLARAKKELLQQQNRVQELENHAAELVLATQRATVDAVNSTTYGLMARAREQAERERQQREKAEEALRSAKERVRQLELELAEVTLMIRNRTNNTRGEGNDATCHV
jgi:hypothetical protein